MTIAVGEALLAVGPKAAVKEIEDAVASNMQDWGKRYPHAGYGAVKKKELTGAVAQVKSEDITKINTSDLGNALQGMVSGVSVTAESGAPGAGSRLA